MVFQDLPADEQTQSGAVGLGGEERLEEPAAIGDRDAAAVVFDGQDEPAVFDRGRRHGCVPDRRSRRSRSRQVEDDLSQVVAHAHDRRQVGGNIGRDRALLGALVVLGDPQGFVDDLGDPDPATAVEAGREKSISSRIVRSIRCNWRAARSSFSAV